MALVLVLALTLAHALSMALAHKQAVCIAWICYGFSTPHCCYCHVQGSAAPMRAVTSQQWMALGSGFALDMAEVLG